MARKRNRRTAAEWFRQVGPEQWYIAGSGAMLDYTGFVSHEGKFGQVLQALEDGGIAVDRRSNSSPANAAQFTWTASFDGGSLRVVSGNYWFGDRGGTVSGRQALERLVALLGLSVSARTAQAWGIDATPRPPAPPKQRA
jgi:hypothetical protein